MIRTLLLLGLLFAPWPAPFAADIISDRGDPLSRSTTPAALATPMPAGPPAVVPAPALTPAPLSPVPAPPPASPLPASPSLAVESPGQPRPVYASAPAPPPVLVPNVAETGLRVLFLPIAILAFLLFTLVHHLRKRQRGGS